MFKIPFVELDIGHAYTYSESKIQNNIGCQWNDKKYRGSLASQS